MIGNSLLAAMTEHDRIRLSPFLEPVVLEQQQALFEPYEEIEHVYFLLSGLCSQLARATGGKQAEVGCVGHEGLVGHSFLLGASHSPLRSIMQVPGRALRIRSTILAEEMQNSSTLRAILFRYVHVFMIQLSSSALADAQFLLGQRLARWLLMCQDRVGNQLPLTHELLALTLGVRRSGVTAELHRLEGDHLIKASRAHIVILDRRGLLAKANGSYGLPEEEYERLITRTSE